MKGSKVVSDGVRTVTRTSPNKTLSGLEMQRNSKEAINAKRPKSGGPRLNSVKSPVLAKYVSNPDDPLKLTMKYSNNLHKNFLDLNPITDMKKY